jgi:hypothetical protein
LDGLGLDLGGKRKRRRGEKEEWTNHSIDGMKRMGWEDNGMGKEDG